MENRKISVIVPAYNAEDTIQRCLDSILRQTYRDLEIIVVNDGSIDATEKTAMSVAERDRRVRVLSIDNGGVSHARNVGIDNAVGQYLTFVDADDYIDADMYQSLMELIKRYGVKIAHCSYSNDDEKGNVLSIVGGKGAVLQQDHDEALSCLIDGRKFAGGLWNKLYHASLFEKTRLDESIKYYEDVLMNYYLFDAVEKSVYTDAPYYHYVAMQSSSTHSAKGLASTEHGLYVSRRMLELSKDKPYQPNAENRLVKWLLGMYRAYVFANDKKNRSAAKAILRELKEYRKRGYLSSRKDRGEYFMYRYLPRTFSLCYKIYDRIRVKKLDPEQDYE